MSCTRALPLLLLLLAGCTSLPRHDPDGGASAGMAALGSSAEVEVAQYRAAITALNGSQLELAQAEFRRLTKARPELAGPWINLALIDIRNNDLEAARKHLAIALERNPRMPQVFNLRGFVELSQGNAQKAADDYRQAIALRDDYAMAHFNFALVHDVYFQDLTVAVRHYRRYLELVGDQDKKTAEWVVELERQLAEVRP